MSSSLMAAKTTEYLQGEGHDVTIETIGATEGNKGYLCGDFTIFYLISPQTRMYFKQFEETGKKADRPVVQIPPQAYVPHSNWNSRS